MLLQGLFSTSWTFCCINWKPLLGLHHPVLKTSQMNAETEKTQAFYLRTVVHIALTKWNVKLMHWLFVQAPHKSLQSHDIRPLLSGFTFVCFKPLLCFLIQNYRSLTSNETDSTWDFLACASFNAQPYKNPYDDNDKWDLQVGAECSCRGSSQMHGLCKIMAFSMSYRSVWRRERTRKREMRIQGEWIWVI